MWLEHNEQEAERLEMRQGKVTASSYGTEPSRLVKNLEYILSIGEPLNVFKQGGDKKLILWSRLRA